MQTNKYLNKNTDFKKLKNFLQFPRILLSAEFKGLSTDAKFLYMLLFDRIKISKENNWFDEDGTIYVFYTYKSIKEDTGMSEPTISKVFKELIDYDLIKKKSTGKNKPDKIYIKNINSCTKEIKVPLLKKFKYRHLKNLSTTTKKNLVQALKNFKSNKNNINKNKYNKNNRIKDQPQKQKTNFENYQQKVIQKIEIIVGNILMPNEIMKLIEHQKDTGQEWEVILKAYEFVDENKKSKNINYVLAILRNWFSDYGIRTVEDLEKARENKEKNNRAKNRKDRYIEDKDILTEEEKKKKLDEDNKNVMDLLKDY